MPLFKKSGCIPLVIQLGLQFLKGWNERSQGLSDAIEKSFKLSDDVT